MFFLAQGGYMAGKAVFSQHLLARAWQQTLHDGKTQKSTHQQVVNKPWPWADVYPVALLRIPQLKLKQIVLNNDSGQALAFGPGLTAFVEGHDGISNIHLISAHRDTHFQDLQHINEDAQIMLENALGNTKRYRVTNVFIMDTRVNTLTVNKEENEMVNSIILITCYPFSSVSASTPYRFIVEAQQSF